MYAVIRTGGKQYRVKAGDILEVETLSSTDGTVTFAPLLVSTDDGQTLHGSEAATYVVGASILGETKGKKIIIFKYKNKTGYASKTGHRQHFSRIEITSVRQESLAAAQAAAE